MLIIIIILLQYTKSYSHRCDRSGFFDVVPNARRYNCYIWIVQPMRTKLRARWNRTRQRPNRKYLGERRNIIIIIMICRTSRLLRNTFLVYFTDKLCWRYKKSNCTAVASAVDVRLESIRIGRYAGQMLFNSQFSMYKNSSSP